MSTPQFSLLSEPWLKVRHLEGHVEDVGLRELYDRMGEFTDLAGESATQDQAVFRLLLGLLVRALRRHELFGPGDAVAQLWDEIRASDELGSLVGTYLDSCEGRFGLFNPVAPFFQVAGLTTAKGEYSDASVLIPDVGPGLFSTSTREAGAVLPAAVAARWLVYTQAYDVSGIKSGAVGDPRVKNGKGYPIGTGWAGAVGSVQIMGPTLRDTLVLNLPVEALLAPDEEVEVDLPPWERTPDTAAPRSADEVTPAGVVDALTWQQRRIRLLPDETGIRVTGALICNGDRIKRANNFVDPTTGYRRSKAQSKQGVEVYFPKTHDPDLTVWRGIQSLFLEHHEGGPQDRRPGVIAQLESDLKTEVTRAYADRDTTVRLTGMSYGTQDAVINGEIAETYPIHVRLLTDEGAQLRQLATTVVGRVMSFRGSMAWFHKQLLVSAGASPEEAPAAPVQSWLSALETQFVEWLAYLGELPARDAAERDWARRMAAVTRRFVADAVIAAGPRAAIGRSEETETGGMVLHSSARYEAWIYSKLREALEGAVVRS